MLQRGSFEERVPHFGGTVRSKISDVFYEKFEVILTDERDLGFVA